MYTLFLTETHLAFVNKNTIIEKKFQLLNIVWLMDICILYGIDYSSHFDNLHINSSNLIQRI